MEAKGIFEVKSSIKSVENGNSNTIVISIVENRSREISLCKIETENVIDNYRILI